MPSSAWKAWLLLFTTKATMQWTSLLDLDCISPPLPPSSLLVREPTSPSPSSTQPSPPWNWKWDIPQLVCTTRMEASLGWNGRREVRKSTEEPHVQLPLEYFMELASPLPSNPILSSNSRQMQSSETWYSLLPSHPSHHFLTLIYRA